MFGLVLNSLSYVLLCVFFMNYFDIHTFCWVFLVDRVIDEYGEEEYNGGFENEGPLDIPWSFLPKREDFILGNIEISWELLVK